MNLHCVYNSIERNKQTKMGFAEMDEMVLLCLFVCLFACLFVCVCLFIYLFVCLFVCLFFFGFGFRFGWQKKMHHVTTLIALFFVFLTKEIFYENQFSATNINDSSGGK